MMETLWGATVLLCGVAGQPLPTVAVTGDDTVIDRSCRVTFPAGVVRDVNGNGVLLVRGDGITVEFTDGAVLRGAEDGARPDEFHGVGVRIDAARNVTLRNARVRGFKVGVHASKTPGLTIDGGEFTDNFRQRLKSTPAAEDEGDWLWPHKNDANEWMTNYGGAVVVEGSEGVTIRGVTVRRGQNGIVLDRVTDSMVYDNDCSFLSGWGLAMWRCRGNVVSRNAFDFCVRGYSHGVYNRGQDSAGVLFFEQNHGNVIAENSATHGGDGFFGFGGREALGEDGVSLDRRGAGNRDNLIINNDFSYAPAHGIELTFGFENRVIGNRVVENAICGVWGGYSQGTLIAGNTFAGNGDAGYGSERGGVNIEHGAGNMISGNTFRKNICGVHLWWDNDPSLMALPWAAANDRGSGTRRMPSIDNLIADNVFEGDNVAIHLRDCDSTVAVRNRFSGVEKEIEATPGSEPAAKEEAPVSWAMPEYTAHGVSSPVGARETLRGRHKIVMTEWGPWDHESPLVRLASVTGDTHTYEAFHLNRGAIKVLGAGVQTEFNDRTPMGITIRAPEPGAYPYVLSAAQGEFEQDFRATIVNATWDVVFFPWDAPDPPSDESGTARTPPDLDAWRALARGPSAVTMRASRLAFRHGHGGPSEGSADPALRAARLPRDYFGMIARTRLPLRAGTWRITTTSDDGVRVLVDGRAVIENWTHHGPTRDSGEFTVDADRAVDIAVEHVEIMGFAVLEIDLEHAG